MERFIDGIGAIRISNGLVRIQTTRPMQNRAGETVTQDRGELVMTMATFLQVRTALNGATDQMLERGLLARREDASPEATADTPADASIDIDLDAMVDSKPGKSGKAS